MQPTSTAEFNCFLEFINFPVYYMALDIGIHVDHVAALNMKP